MRRTILGSEGSKNILSSFKNLLGNSKHQWMWDYKSMAYELNEAGFKSIHNCVFGDSVDKQFLTVEEEGRFYGAVAFECSK
jgi:hypothetical protein